MARKALGLAPTNAADATTKSYVDSKAVPSVYSTTIGNGVSTTFIINHNLGTRNLTLTVYDASTFEVIQCDRTLTDANNVTLTFGAAPSTGAYTVVVLGGALLTTPNVFTQTIGDGSTTVFTINHNLGSRSVNVNVYDASTFKMVHPDRALTSTNSVTITFQSAPAANAYVVVVQGGILASSSVASTNITDATTVGRNLLTAATSSAAQTVLGATSIGSSLLTAANATSALALLTPLQTAASAYVAAAEATSSTSYVDLTTTTDTVTVTVGASGAALVTLSAVLTSGAASEFPYMSFAMSGANTSVGGVSTPDDSLAGAVRSYAAAITGNITGAFVLTGLSSGSTTFKAKYRVASGTTTFASRRIAVIPL